MPTPFDIEDVLDHCIFALGSGARMPIKREAIRAIQDHVRGPFTKEIERAKDPLDPDDPLPGQPRWDMVRNFMLACCEAIGRLAASKAIGRGSMVIALEDLKSAYNTVSNANQPPGPGRYCPAMP